MVVRGSALVAAQHDHHRTVLHVDIVDHDADRGEIFVGVRVERPILVPFDRRAIAGRLHVEFAGVKTQAAPQIGQQFNDLGVAAGAHVDRVDRMWRLQSAHPRLVRRVRVLQVINRVVGGHRRRRGNELVGHPTQLRDILSREDFGDDDEAIPIIGGALCTCEHSVSPLKAASHAKESGIQAIELRHYPGLRRAHNEQIFNRHKPVLDAMGDQAAYIGPIGADTIAKLVHNCTSTVMGVALAEVFTMGIKAGVEPLDLWEAVRQGATQRPA